MDIIITNEVIVASVHVVLVQENHAALAAGHDLFF